METEHYVGPGAVCFYEDSQPGEWHEAVFHKWVGPGFSPMAIVHDKKNRRMLHDYDGCNKIQKAFT